MKNSRRLEQPIPLLKRAWEKYVTSDGRKAVYFYLEPIFSEAVKMSAYEAKSQPIDSSAEDWFAILISRTANSRIADRKTRSKWCRALRFAALAKPPQETLTSFVARQGGLNRCAHAHAALAAPMGEKKRNSESAKGRLRS
jgi:hypothetical protein